MTTTTQPAEVALNNAIVLLSRSAMKARSESALSLGAMVAIKALADHWELFWRSSERSALPSVLLLPKLNRYAEWYTRGWAILPPAYRGSVPRPDQIDPAFGRVTRDTMQGLLTGVESTGQTAKDIAAWSERQATGLRKAIQGSVSTGVIGIVLGAFAAWYFLRQSGRKGS